MIKPYIYFCGDESKCRSIMKNYRQEIKAVFISERNADKFLINPKRHPALICIMFDKAMHANADLFRAVYKYSLITRCPLCISGSRNHLTTAVRYAKGAVIQRVNTKVMLHIIKNLCRIANETPEGEFALFKTRFDTAAIISENASSSSLLENSISGKSAFFRTITISEKSDEYAFKYLSRNNLSGIISDCTINENLLNMLSNSPDIPLIFTKKSGMLPKNIKAHRVDITDENINISDILNDYIKKRSKFLYTRNK